MKVKVITAIVLISAGVIILAYSGITFTTPGETVQFLGLRIETRETHFVPPVIGAVLLVGGIGLLFLKTKPV
jgi:hypothetical protein